MHFPLCISWWEGDNSLKQWCDRCKRDAMIDRFKWSVRCTKVRIATIIQNYQVPIIYMASQVTSPVIICSNPQHTLQALKSPRSMNEGSRWSMTPMTSQILIRTAGGRIYSIKSPEKQCNTYCNLQVGIGIYKIVAQSLSHEYGHARAPHVWSPAIKFGSLRAVSRFNTL